MKFDIVVKKGKELKQGTITINSNLKNVCGIIQSHGWKVLSLEKVHEVDENTQIVNLGVPNENTI